VLLRTQRLIIRPLTLSDTEAYHSIVGDPLVMKFLGDGKPQTREAAVAYVEACVKSEAENGFSRYAVLETRSGVLIGLCGYKRTEQGVDLGWRVQRHHWGRGFATEAAMAVLHHGVNDLGLPGVYSICAAENVASVRVAEKIGMILDGIGQVGGWTVQRYVAPMRT
jgi:ribosomal-protein-alanine N-acetyltransferase